MAKFIARRQPQGPHSGRVAPQRIRILNVRFPTEDDGSRDDVLFGQNTTPHDEPDFEALRAASTRIVLAAGADSEGAMAHRGALAIAERLGTKAVIFPSYHGGFLGGEYGQSASRKRSPRNSARCSPGESALLAAVGRRFMAALDHPFTGSRGDPPGCPSVWIRPSPRSEAWGRARTRENNNE